MNSFWNGLFTGIMIVSIIAFLLGNQKHPSKDFSKTYKQKLLELENRISGLESSVEERFLITGQNFLFLKDMSMISENTEYYYKTMSLLGDPYIFNSLSNDKNNDR